MKNKFYLVFLISIFIYACGDNNSNKNDENHLKRENSVDSLIQISDGNSLQKSLKVKTSSADDTHPVYFYSQNFDLEKNTYKKSYDLNYKFRAEDDYSFNISFDDSKKQPSKMQLWVDSKVPELDKVFSCGDQQEPNCDNITLEVDHKTGQSKVNFDQTKIYDHGKKSLTLSGSISGQLKLDPTIVHIPTSGVYNATYRISDNNQDISMTQPNFRFFSFTNHNIQDFFTSQSIYENMLYIHTINNIVNEVWYTPSMPIYPLAIWNREDNTNLQNISYNPINLTVNFNQFKMSNDNYPDIYLNGTVGP
ncbi:hypothetical protein [Acinetobacter defluvii]|uniref:hypothetical protein n=1 Tax=Acinetobacter defluvii TaxID=1871111 RepID=UPI003AF9E41B